MACSCDKSTRIGISSVELAPWFDTMLMPRMHLTFAKARNHNALEMFKWYWMHVIPLLRSLIHENHGESYVAQQNQPINQTNSLTKTFNCRQVEEHWSVAFVFILSQEFLHLEYLQSVLTLAFILFLFLSVDVIKHPGQIQLNRERIYFSSCF